MELIAHVSVRRHLIESVRERDSSYGPPKSVAVFRVLGQSPRQALKVLGANTESPGTNSTVALALGADVLTDNQAEVCQAVISECRSQATELLMCGNDLTQLRQRVAPEFSMSRWFPTVAEMVQQLGKEDARHLAQSAERSPGEEALAKA
jgi:hypothetical protein